VADVHCHWSAEVTPEALVADMDRLTAWPARRADRRLV
jgi:hypothetical protein